MGDPAKIVDPVNMLGTQKNTSNQYEMQLPAFLRTDPKLTEPFVTPTYKKALENYWGTDYPTINQNIRNWLEATAPRTKVKVGTKTVPVGSPFGTVMGGMIPTKQSLF